MTLYRILFGIGAAAAAVIGFFFLWGLSDGTVSAANIVLWLMLLAGPALVLGTAYRLAAAGRQRAAAGVAAVLAVPAALVGLFFLLLILMAPDWH